MEIPKILEEAASLEQVLAMLPQNIQYDGPIDEHVYDTLSCNLIPECRLPWVEELFISGHRYYETYSEMLEAYESLLARLGKVNDDEDVEIIIHSLLEHGRIIAMKMFEYGRKYEKMQNE